MPTTVTADCGAGGKFRLRTHCINPSTIRPNVFRKLVFTEDRTAYSHVRAPNIMRRDWPLQEIGARIHNVFRHAAQHPIWRMLFPNGIDSSTEDIVIDFLRRDALNRYQPVRGEYNVVVGQRHYL